jgi:F0F1-type ATP synthase membrane subunit c/vacuolar-type H+-ATPase subunit K
VDKIPPSTGQSPRTALKIWWMIWAAILAGLCAIYFALGRVHPLPVAASTNPLVNLVGLVPLFISIIIRWLVLPRYAEPARAFPMFIIGLALAEACGLLGVFLGGPYRDDLFVLGVLGIFQFMPFFARTYFQSKPPGFIPNN